MIAAARKSGRPSRRVAGLMLLLTVVVTFTGTFYVSSIIAQSRQPEFRRLTFELREARAAWEREGSSGLTRFLARLKEATGADAGLAYSNGIDVLTGRDWTPEIKAPQYRFFFSHL